MNIKKISDDELVKLAEEYKVSIGEDMEREDVEKVVTEAMKKGKIDIKDNKTKETKKTKDTVRLKYLARGSVKKFGIKWQGRMEKDVTVEQASSLLSAFPDRFIERK